MTEKNIRTLADYINFYLPLYGDHTFLSESNGRSITYGKAGEEITQIQRLFAQNKIKKGDKIAILGDNSVNWGLTYLAIVSYGATVVPILANFSLSNVHNILAMSEAKIVFVSAGNLYKLEGVSLPNLRRGYILETFESFEITVIPDLLEKISTAIKKIKSHAVKVLGRDEKSDKTDGFTVTEEDIASIIYTSGTTGKSKGVMLSHRNILSNARTIIPLVHVSHNDQLLSILPMAHAFECTAGFLAPIQAGASIHFIGAKPSPSRLLKAFAETSPTIVIVVPLIIEKIYFKRIKPQLEKNIFVKSLTHLPIINRVLYRKAATKLLAAFGGRLRHLVIGGAPLNPEVESFLIKGRFPYIVGYGMTETSPIISAFPPSGGKHQSCGKPVEYVSVKIDSDDSIGGIGEILVKGPNTTKGYYKNEEATKELFDEQGWLKTGDLGYMDRDGFIFIKGRSKNMILGPSGENIYPEEIEQLFNQATGVTESLVMSREGRILVSIVPDYDALREQLDLYTLDDGEIRRRINDYFEHLLTSVNKNLPDFSRVRKFEIKDHEFEKTPTEKIKRYLYQ